jgi:hypothetical protein
MRTGLIALLAAALGAASGALITQARCDARLEKVLRAEERDQHECTDECHHAVSIGGTITNW